MRGFGAERKSARILHAFAWIAESAQARDPDAIRRDKRIKARRVESGVAVRSFRAFDAYRRYVAADEH